MSLELKSKHPVIVTAASDEFGLPAAVMLRSAVDRISGNGRLIAFIIDCGMSKATVRKLKKSLPQSWVNVTIIKLDEDSFHGLVNSERFTYATYARLFIEALLPPYIERCIFVDADMLFLADVHNLWSVNLDGKLLAAVQDPVAGVVGRSAQMMHWDGSDVPLGTNIFNAGLMLIDLAGWRNAHLSQRVLHALRMYPDRMKWFDQDGLNYIIRGNFKLLSPQWNVMPHIYYPPHSHETVYNEVTIKTAIEDPWCIHLSGGCRPWRGPNRHWRETDFYQSLYRTAFRDDVYCAPWMGRRKSWLTKLLAYCRKNTGLGCGDEA